MAMLKSSFWRKRLVFANIISYSRLRLWVSYFFYYKFTRVLFYLMSLVQCHLKNWRNLKKCTSFEEQKSTMYIRRNLYFGIVVFSFLSSTNQCLRFLLICFAREIKGFYQSSLGNEVDFRDIINVSPNILAKN